MSHDDAFALLPPAADQQQAAADAATLQTVREPCQRASDARVALAARTERGETARLEAASAKLLKDLNENPERVT